MAIFVTPSLLSICFIPWNRISLITRFKGTTAERHYLIVMTLPLILISEMCQLYYPYYWYCYYFLLLSGAYLFHFLCSINYNRCWVCMFPCVCVSVCVLCSVYALRLPQGVLDKSLRRNACESVRKWGGGGG